MDRDQIVAALTRLGERMSAIGVVGELYVVGGAAMALAYDLRRTTRDIDAVFEPKSVIYREASYLASELGLPEDWLNDAVKGFLLGAHDGAIEVLEAPGIRVTAASPVRLLAMKCLAHRPEDQPDVLALAAILNLTDARSVLDAVEAQTGARLLTAQLQFYVEALFDQA